VLPVGTGRRLRNGRVASSATKVRLPRPPRVTRHKPILFDFVAASAILEVLRRRRSSINQAPADDRGFAISAEKPPRQHTWELSDTATRTTPRTARHREREGHDFTGCGKTPVVQVLGRARLSVVPLSR